MLKTIILTMTVIFVIKANGQSKKSFELSLVSRYDQHADYVTNFAGRAYNDTMKLFGLSNSVNIQFRKTVSPTYSVYIGIGYHRLGIIKIKSTMPFELPGVSTGRSIENGDDDSTKLGYSTSKYHYNNVAFTFGMSKSVLLRKRLKLDIGAEGVSYYSLSQSYKLLNAYHYTTTNGKPLEFGVNATVGLFKEYAKFYIRPALLVPFYQSLRGDRVFFEDRDMRISKWFNGAGLTVKIGKYLK